MIGFRLLAIILGVLCLLTAAAVVFHSHPALSGVAEFFVEKFIPAGSFQSFIRSARPGDMLIKSYLKYILSGYAVVAVGLGILFIISAINPMRMRPFISVVMIGSVLVIAVALWKGLTLDINYLWWAGDALSALILLVLLAALYPRRRVKTVPAPEIMDQELEE